MFSTIILVVTLVAKVIEKKGSQVQVFELGDQVVGFLPLDNDNTGYAEYCIAESFYFVHLPRGVPFERAAASVLQGIRCYYAFQSVHKVVQGETVFIPRGAHSSSCYALQYACIHGARVITTVASDEELNYLQDLQISISRLANLLTSF